MSQPKLRGIRELDRSLQCVAQQASALFNSALRGSVSEQPEVKQALKAWPVTLLLDFWFSEQDFHWS